MFSGGNSTPFTMPVTPAYGGNGGGMGGWGNDWIALAILALIFGDGWGMGGMGGMGMFLPFMFMNGGWGGFGGNGGDSASAQGALTREQACIDNNFQNLMRETAGISDAVNVGFANLNSTICHQQYDTAQLINGVNNNINQGFHGVDNAICTLGYNTQQGFNQTNIALMQGQNALATQIADCCCRTQSNLKDIQFQNAQDTCAVTNTIQNTTRDIIDNQNANSRQILDFLVNDKISTLQQENQNLKLAASQAAQNNYLLSELKPCPQPAYLTCNPFTGQYGGYGYNGYGYNNGCGCNSGCCGCNA